MTTLAWGAATDAGRIRDVNQDGYHSAETIFVVADGMGGHSGGEVASATAVEHLAVAASFNSVDELLEAVQRANREVLDLARQEQSLYGMGTTLVALAAMPVDGSERYGNERLCVANVGDSRLYLRTPDEMMQLTDDHSLVDGMVRDGWITPSEAKVHPQRSVVTRALGVEEPLLVDAWELVPVTGDRYLLCSDGLNNELDDAEIEEILAHAADPQQAAAELVRAACDAGGRDNVTVVVVDVVAAEPPASDPPVDRVVAAHKAEAVPMPGAVPTPGAAPTPGAVPTDRASEDAEPIEVAAPMDSAPQPRRLFSGWGRIESWPLRRFAALALIVSVLLLVLFAVL